MKKGRPKIKPFTLGDNPILACTIAIHEALDQFGYESYMGKGPREVIDVAPIFAALDALSDNVCQATLLGLLRLERRAPKRRLGVYERFCQAYLLHCDKQRNVSRYEHLAKDKRLADHL